MTTRLARVDGLSRAYDRTAGVRDQHRPNRPHPTIKLDALGLVQASPDRADLLALAKAIAEGEVSSEFTAEVSLL